jgi:hypothetical protein
MSVDLKTIQQHLSDIGLLDPPADGILGPTTRSGARKEAFRW